MSNYLSIACLQYASTKDENKTLKIVEKLIVEAVNFGTELIALPECATSLHENSTVTKEFAPYEEESISLNFLKKSAKFYSINTFLKNLVCIPNYLLNV